jgi:DHA1 family multidrug resistance protein-like MFS transporter
MGYTRRGGRSDAENQVLLLIAVNALFGFAVGFSSPSVAPLIVALGVSISFVGQAQTVGGLGTTFLRLPVGIAMDRIGRKPFIVIGGLVTLLGFISYAFATYWLLLGSGIVLVTLDYTIRGTAATASLGDATRAGRIGRVFSLDLGVTESAGTIAPIVGGYVATTMTIPSHLMFATSAVLVLIAITVVSIAYKPAPAPRTQARTADSWREYLRVDRRIVPLALIVALDAATWRISFPFWALYIFKEMNATQEQLGIAIAISAGIPALTGLTLGNKLDKAGRKPFLALSEWSSIGAFLPLLLTSRAEFAYISAVFWGLVYSLYVPALNAYVVDHFGSERFGQTLGTLSLVAGVASVASPALGGWMWDNISPKSPFILTLVLANIVGILIWFKVKERRDQTVGR